MSDLTDDWKVTLEAMARTLTEPRRPLGPLLVPDWLPALCEAKGHDLDTEARAYGFDGYALFDKVCTPVNCGDPEPPRSPNRAERRARR